MIAAGRDKAEVVLLGTDADGKLVQVRCTEEEAGSLLRQLSAILGAPAQSGTAYVMAPRPASSLIVTDLGDPAAEARERDAAALAAQGGPGPARPGRAPTRSAEDLERQEARRQRLRGAGNGIVEGPVDE
jgi:hypothetical protein